MDKTEPPERRSQYQVADKMSMNSFAKFLTNVNSNSGKLYTTILIKTYCDWCVTNYGY